MSKINFEICIYKQQTCFVTSYFFAEGGDIN